MHIYMYLNKADIFHDIFSILAYRIKKKNPRIILTKMWYIVSIIYLFFLLVLTANVCTSKCTLFKWSNKVGQRQRFGFGEESAEAD